MEVIYWRFLPPNLTPRVRVIYLSNSVQAMSKHFQYFGQYWSNNEGTPLPLRQLIQLCPDLVQLSGGATIAGWWPGATRGQNTVLCPINYPEMWPSRVQVLHRELVNILLASISRNCLLLLRGEHTAHAVESSRYLIFLLVALISFSAERLDQKLLLTNKV